MPIRNGHPDVTGFGGVDAAGDPASLAAFLDIANELPGLRAANQALADELLLGQAQAALDVGCGTGADVIAMAQRLPQGGRATGIDLSEAMITEARRRVRGLGLAISFDTGDAASLPYGDASFDACFAKAVLQHVPDPSQVIREMARVTRPGGRIAALDFDQGSAMLDHPDGDTTQIILRTFADAMAHGWIGRQLPRLFRQAGLTDLSIAPTVVLSEPQVFHAVFGSHVDQLRADNVLSGHQADRWWRILAEQAADGHFLGGAAVFVVAATRPGQQR